MPAGHVVMIGGAAVDERGAEIGTVIRTQGDLPPVPEVKEEDLDVLRNLAAAVAGDDEALGRALSVDAQKRQEMLGALQHVPNEELREQMRKTLEKGLGDQNAREAILAARPYYARLRMLARDFSLDFERVEEHGRGVRLVGRWTFFDAIQGRDFRADQSAYPRGSLGKIAEVAEFVRATCEQLAMRAFHESIAR